ncbi:MAG: DJ-1/PfpI family protein [Pseudomonadota bacterium]
MIGSERWAEETNPEVVDLLRRVSAAGAPIGTICAGTLAAARAGLLNGRAHTSNSLEFLKANAVGYAGADLYDDTPRAVSCGGVVTAPGSAPGSFSVEVLRLAVPDQSQAIDAYAKMLAADHGR